jgi:Domain of unknown function (DUF5916)
MNSNVCYILALVLACASAQPARAQARPDAVPWLDTPPHLEDLVNGGLAHALALTGFQQRDPNDGDPATEPTSAYLARDARHLYVGFVCVDRTPARVRARLARRDAILQDDQVIVLLDTFHDRRRAYLFAANPLGIQADASVAEGKDDDYSFDAVWGSEGRLTEWGFVVLFTIPFRSLRLSPDSDGAWGVALSRLLPRNSEQSFWPYITRRTEGLTQQFASLGGFDRAEGGRNVQLIPYAAAAAGRFLDPHRSAFDAITEGRAGLHAKLVVRDATTIDVALNPDFSQVESDAPQVSINQRFELFYPEKRPFFLENSTLFRYPSVPPTRTLPETLFFSRRIQDPQFGVRVTGQQRGWAFGGLVASDRGADGTDASAATAAIARLQRAFGDQSSVGVMVTSRDAARQGNQVAAADLRWKIAPNWVFTGQAMASQSRSGGERLAGPAYHAALLYTARNVFATLFYADRSPSFRAALGFVPRTDIRQIEHYGEYRRRPRTGPVVAYGPNSFVRLNWDHAGRLQEWIVRFPFQVDLKGRTSVFVRRVESGERFAGIDLREHFQTIDVSTEWLKWLVLTEGFEWGRTPNYFPAAGVAPSVARSVSASIGVTVRPTPRVRYEQTLLYTGFRALPAGNGGNPPVIFSDTIARSTVNYQFTRALSLRTILDYGAVIPNPTLVQLTRDKRVGFDTLFTYQVGPSTALYAGYTDAFQNVTLGSDGAPVTPGRTPGASVGRQAIVKLSYLFRL